MEIYTLDLNFNFKDLDGNETKENAAKVLGSSLCYARSGEDAAIFSLIGQQLYKNGSCSMNKLDLDKIENFCNQKDLFSNLAKAKYIEAIQDARKKAPPKLTK